jgi:hypothetical protein
LWPRDWVRIVEVQGTGFVGEEEKEPFYRRGVLSAGVPEAGKNTGEIVFAEETDKQTDKYREEK